MPPASRNHRVPTAGDTPALTAASSLECPVAIAAQNRRCFSCRRTEGRPGERSFARPARSERLLRVVIATPFGAVLRRPVELKGWPLDLNDVDGSYRVIHRGMIRGRLAQLRAWILPAWVDSGFDLEVRSVVRGRPA